MYDDVDSNGCNNKARHRAAEEMSDRVHASVQRYIETRASVGQDRQKEKHCLVRLKAYLNFSSAECKLNVYQGR